MLKNFTSRHLTLFGMRRLWIAFAMFSSALSLPMTVAADDSGNSGVPPTAVDTKDSLASVRDRMQQAQSLLAARDASGRASTTQREVVSELDAMIAKLQKQCESCGGQCSKPPGPENKPQEKASKPSGKSGAKAGETSATAPTKPAVVDRVAIADLVKDLWGRLPERQREVLMQPLSEEFLPEYAADIEEYFRVLAESPAHAAAERQP